MDDGNSAVIYELMVIVKVFKEKLEVLLNVTTGNLTFYYHNVTLIYPRTEYNFFVLLCKFCAQRNVASESSTKDKIN